MEVANLVLGIIVAAGTLALIVLVLRQIGQAKAAGDQAGRASQRLDELGSRMDERLTAIEDHTGILRSTAEKHAEFVVAWTVGGGTDFDENNEAPVPVIEAVVEPERSGWNPTRSSVTLMIKNIGERSSEKFRIVVSQPEGGCHLSGNQRLDSSQHSHGIPGQYDSNWSGDTLTYTVNRLQIGEVRSLNAVWLQEPTEGTFSVPITVVDDHAGPATLSASFTVVAKPRQ